MMTVAFVLIGIGVLLYVLTPLFAKRDTIEEASRREHRRRQMVEERERVYEAIKELDFDYRMGKVEEADYRQTRARYEAEAVELMKVLDKTNGHTDRIEAVPVGDLDEEIEREVAAIRAARNQN